MSATDYEEVPYEGYAHPQTHPDNLAVIATLQGLSPAPPQRCRVLELECGDGSNLVPMAHGLPESQFVGLDASVRKIEKAKAFAEAVGVHNLDLRVIDPAELSPALGPFDFIICHNAFSWSAPPVQDRILAFCAEALSLGGVAYVRYNVFPGWFPRGAVAEMLNLHAQRFDKASERVKQARALLEFLAEYSPSSPDSKSAFAHLLHEERDRLRALPDSHFLQEVLSDVHHPLYFYQFCERARATGLDYLAEARLVDMSPMRFADKAQEALPKLAADALDREQYMDFLVGRWRRHTLLCHQGIYRNRALTEATFQSFHVASAARPAQPETDPTTAEVEEFVGPEGSRISLRPPIVRAALRQLGETSPQAVPFNHLLEGARRRLGRADENDAQTLADALHRCCHWGMVNLHLHWPVFTAEATERPMAFPVARYQAGHGNRVANALHQTVAVTNLDRLLLSRLDGGQERAALKQMLLRLYAEGSLQAALKADDQPERLLEQTLDESLRRLAGHALLVG